MFSNYKIESLLVATPGVLNYNPKNFFEVQPNRKSPIFVNIKKTLGNASLRDILITSLLGNIPSNINFICGIESGGTYFASVIAHKLHKPLLFYRKQVKKYAEKGNFVGTIPTRKSSVLIIDDVIVSGATIEPVIYCFKNLGCEIYVRTIFSLGYNNFIKKRLAINLQSIIKIRDLLLAANRNKFFSKKDVTFLKKFFIRQEKEFTLKYVQR